MELSAELTGRDGTCRPFQVSCERSLAGLGSGLDRLKEQVSAVLSDLVLREKGEGNPGELESAGEEEEDDDDDEEDGSDENNRSDGTGSNGPPTKRTKMHC